MKSSSLYQRLSLFKKFLLAPVLGLVLVVPISFYLLLTTKDIQKKVHSINDESFPLYALTRDNVMLLEKISHEISSAVAAKESLWLEDAFVHAQLMKKNMREYRNTHFEKEAQELAENFEEYFEHVIELSENIIKSDGYYEGIEQDTRLSVEYYMKLDFLLKSLQEKIDAQIQGSIRSLDDNTSLLLLKGGLLFSFWFISTILMTFFVYRDVKKRIDTIVKASQDIAKKDANFSNRLELPMQDELGEVVYSLNTFISKLAQKHKDLRTTKEKLDSLYVRDKLTGLYNRVKIDEVIAAEKNRFERYKTPFCLVLIDIDYFKKLNDSYGHLVGDKILQQFAQLLQKNTRKTDFAARWGGEEFLIVLPQTDEVAAFNLAEKLRKIIESEMFGEHTLSASFGVACYEQKQSQDQILHNADKALYEAKKRGRNQVVRFESL